MTRCLLTLTGTFLLAATTGMVGAQEGSGTEESQEPEVVKREEIVVVTASKVESTLINAPATMSVVTADMLASSPAQNYGDVLRTVPGLNVIQMSARDINLTSRQATSTLANSQLALLDGRSIYLDFFGLILWDLVPSNFSEIKQIEVVRGPASAVWGANALTGVVNIITKSPRELSREGAGSLTLGAGIITRDEGSRKDKGNGYSYGASATFAQAPSDRFSYKISAGYFDSDPYSRPTGTIPPGTHPFDPLIETGGASYPGDAAGQAGAFENSDTRQPKFDLRVDQELADGGRISYTGGIAGTEGVVHTGIGPFDMQSGSYLGYGRIGYSKGAFKLGAFVNALDAEAPNLLLVDPATLGPVELNFKTQTYDVEIGHSTVLGGRHVVSYGGNARRNNFEITLTPNAENRSEFGAYFQDEIFFDKFRFSLGGRVDKFGNIDDPVFSPRVTAMFKPTPDHSFRVSFNRAFRSPSPVNNFLEQDIFAPTLINDLLPAARLVPLFGARTGLDPTSTQALQQGLSAPFFLRVKSVGNQDLKQESVTAYEIAYTGTFDRTTVGLAVYQNDTDDNINFSNITRTQTNPDGIPPFDEYTSANAPALIGLNVAGQPVPGTLIAFLDFLAAITGDRTLLPRTASTYLNLGPIRQRGVEVSLNHTFNNHVSGFVNYSFQDDPEVLDADSDQIPYPTEEVTIPSRNRFNAGINFHTDRLIGSASVNFTDEAFWTDVFTEPFHAYTDAFTMFNASFGVKWAGGKVVTTVKGTNLTNEKVQQHIFGDILKRSVQGEVRFVF